MVSQTWGAAHYVAQMSEDGPLAVTFYGRDASDAQLVTKPGDTSSTETRVRHSP